MNDLDFLIEQTKSRNDQPPKRLISEWVEGRRILPAASPFPGPWRNERTPFSVEIMDNMSPYNPCQKQAVLKARKLGITTAIENVVAYWIDQVPAEQLYSTANEALTKDWSSKKISHVIDSLGIRHKLIAADQNAKSRRTGDRMAVKEYIGGSLDIITAMSLMARRALDKRCLWIDETDGVEAQTATGEGNWCEILMAHTNSYGARKKITLFGSPSTYEASLITKYYDQGDQRKFLIPCPVCGRSIELKLGNEQTSWGLKTETKAGAIIDAFYICEHCGEAIWDNDKLIFYSHEPRCRKHPEKKLEPAHWEPTVKPDPIFHSYQINSLYSPVGMLSFREVAIEQERAQNEGPDAMRSYVNIYMGLAYKDEGSRPKIENVISMRGAHRLGVVPPVSMFLTVGIDVQRGSKKDVNNPPRLELQVLSHGIGYKTCVIDYKIFYGETGDPYSGAWEEMYEWGEKTQLTYYRQDGMPFKVVIVFIDSGDAYEGRAEVTYRFCERWYPNTYPIKGFGALKADPKKKEKADIPGAGAYKKYRAAPIGNGGETVFEVNTSFYKNELYTNLNVPRLPADPQRSGFIEFPVDLHEEYFLQLTGSEKRINGSFVDIRNRVEAQDTFVYALCARDVWLDSEVQAARTELRSRGATAVQAAQINSKFILERFARAYGVQY
ncbi:MAG: phage terminase large subunit family protein [Treponema sp.]|jgi:phage terminase large subunit GpA-like protein|nr:phage terminase large subunit family protein [Treponema sp.]